MTSFERFETRIPALLEELAIPSLPDYADDLFARTAATRQRPGWSFPERWLPMSTFTARLAGVPRVPWRIGIVVALLAAAALVAALLAGSVLKPRPAPYGPAGNGQVLFVDAQGRVVFGDVATSTTHVVADVEGALSPIVSNDGTRIAFLQESPLLAGRYVLTLANADGSAATQLTTELSEPTYLGWSANGEQLLAVDLGGRMLLFGLTGAAQPTNLSDVAGVGLVQVGWGYHFRSDVAFRPPKGEEILFTKDAMRLMAVRPDGTGLRTILEANAAGFPDGVRGGQWSPDGSKLVFLARSVIAPDGEGWHAYVVNADGTGLHPLSAISTAPLADQNGLLWSPDGTRVAFNYWTHFDGGQDFHGIAIVDVASGAMHEVGPIRPNGWISWDWSPDGRSILGVPSDDSGGNNCAGFVCVARNSDNVDMLIIDATTGTITTAPWRVQQASSWQRVAPR